MFDCRSIAAPDPDKPHIALREGYWRVSSYDPPRSSRRLDMFSEAHRFASNLNVERHGNGKGKQT